MAMKNTNENFALRLEAACARYEARPALFHEGRWMLYGELSRLVDAVADRLARAGIAAGDCVALWMPNGPSFVVSFAAVLRLGATVAPLGILLTPREVLQRLPVAAARLTVTTAKLAGPLRDAGAPVLALSPLPDEPPPAEPVRLAQRAGDDIAVLAFTSGTTGAPKAAEISHAGLAWNTAALAEGFALTPEDVQLAVAPLSHVLGMQGVMNATLTTGGALVLVERFDAAAALELLDETRTTGVMGAPSMFLALVREARAKGESPRLRFAHGGGAPFPPELARSVAETFGCVVREGYGMSEVGGGISHTPLERPAKGQSVGVAFPGSELRVVDRATRLPLAPGQRGEIEVRSPSVMRGYRGDPEGTRAVLDEEGWLSTGDIGYLDDEGYLFLVGRSKELIIRSGYNVFPREIEEILTACPGVSEAAVLGIPDEERGEEIVALVVPMPSLPSLDPETVKAFAKERLAAYKYPRHVLLVDALPKSATGKLMKRDIDRESVAARIREERSR